jgi:hypothetical protein
MELLGDVGQEEAHFGLYGYSVNLGVRYVHGLGLTYHRLENHFGQTMELLGDVGQMKLILVSFEIVLISTKDWCTVCAERAIGSKIILGAPGGTRR